MELEHGERRRCSRPGRARSVRGKAPMAHDIWPHREAFEFRSQQEYR